MPLADLKVSSRWLVFFSALALAAVVFLIYVPSLTTGFFADDYNFLEPVARLDLIPYLIQYFDPRLQTLWYRPLQGIQFLIEWKLFGADAVGYHLVQISIHSINCLLLFALVWRISANWWLGIFSALFYATFPVYALAVNWINITDPLATVFYLLGVWFWWSYLRAGKLRDAIATHVLFVLGVFAKQMVVTLPAILFLLDRLIANSPDRVASFKEMIAWLDLRQAIRRYGAFGLIVLVFALVQYGTRSTHTFAGVFGYGLGIQTLSILIQYLSLGVFPWGYFLPTDTQFTEGMPFSTEWNLIWLAIALMLYLFVMVRTRSRVLMFLALAWFLVILLVLPFPFIELRYLYLPAMVSGIVFALWLDAALTWLGNPRWGIIFATIAAILLVLGSAASIANANAGLLEIARQRRVPFRDISRRHPSFPEDTHLYFIDPISPLPELSGMFLMRYGRSVTVGGDQSAQVSLPREHKNAYVYYFDDTGKPYEVSVEPVSLSRPALPLPVNYAELISLDHVEVVQSKVKRGDVLIVLLYWHATAEISKDYTVFVHVVDKNNKIVAGFDSQPRKGKSPTHQWQVYVPVSDPILLSIPPETPTGNDYLLEIGLYYLPTNERLAIVNLNGVPITDKLVVQPLSIVE